MCGVSENFVDKMEILDGEKNIVTIKEKLKSGDYILVAVFKTTKGTYSSDNLENSPDIGETVTIYKNGKPLKKVEVISQILVIDSEQISGSSVTGDDTILGPWLYLGEGLFKELYGKGNLVNYSFDADEKDAPAVRRMLNQISQVFADV